MNKETDKKRKKPFIEGPGGYIVAAAVGLIILAWVGLILAPFVLFIINRTQNKTHSFGRWLFWFICGLCTFIVITFIQSQWFVRTDPHVYSANVKNTLVNGIKECIVRDADNKSTDFAAAPSFSKKPSLNNYVIKQSSDSQLKNTCFGARAESTIKGPSEFDWLDYNPFRNYDSNYTTYYTWFEVDFKDGIAIKTCGDSSKNGCGEGNQW